MNHITEFAKVKCAELLSTTGALLLGVGLGLLLEKSLATFAIPILLLGSLCHLVGMVGKHRIEAAGVEPTPTWYVFLNWGCWLALLIMLVLIFLIRLQR